MTDNESSPASDAGAKPDEATPPADAASMEPTGAETSAAPADAPAPGAHADAGVDAPTEPATTEAPPAPAAPDAPIAPDAPVAPDTTSGPPVPDAGTPESEAPPETTVTDATPAADLPAEAAPADATVATPAAAAGSGSGPLRSERMQLVDESGRSLTVGVRTVLGKHMVRQFGEDSNVWDAEQCVLERNADGAWQIVPREGTTNETLVNGEVLTAARTLSEGDLIAVGRAAKGIARLPLTVRTV